MAVAGAPSPTRRAVVLLATVLGVVITASLGRWQLHRAAQKEALQQALDERRAELPVLQSAWPADEALAESQHYRRTHARGIWLASHTVFLDNRPMDGRAGFIVVTPLLIAPGQAVVVQRGWVPRDARDRTRLPLVPTPGGEVELDATFAPLPSHLFALGGADAGVIRQNLDPRAYATEMKLRLLPFSLLQQGAPVPDDGLLRHWPRPAFNVQTHYGYAAQWFGLAALMVVLYAWFQWIQPRRQRQRAALASNHV